MKKLAAAALAFELACGGAGLPGVNKPFSDGTYGMPSDATCPDGYEPHVETAYDGLNYRACLRRGVVDMRGRCAEVCRSESGKGFTTFVISDLSAGTANGRAIDCASQEAAYPVLYRESDKSQPKWHCKTGDM